jgi:hypothetical protein
LLGVGTGGPGQVFRAAHIPLVTTTEEFDVLLGVQTPVEQLTEGAPAREHAGHSYEIWQPVATFAGAKRTDKVYLLDRASGTITFAPALDLRAGTDDATAHAGSARPAPRSDPEQAPTVLAAVPPAGREVRLWYRTGGGPGGNVAAHTLTTLRDPVPGVTVTNRGPARGGRSAETIEAAVARGPYEFYSQRRAITARDFELLATAGSPAIARARAFTRASMWTFGRPGEVEVVLVPYVEDGARPDWQLPVASIVDRQLDAVLHGTQQDLDGRRALGTSVVTSWARYKAVSIRGRVVVRVQEDPDAVRQRIHTRLYQSISPLSTPASPSGWTFGQPLRASNVYRLLEQAEPGVRYVDDVRFVVQEAPDSRVRAVAADRFQPQTWYAGCESLLFRSSNAGRGWELVGTFPDETVRRVVPASGADRPGVSARPGYVAVVTRTAEGGSCVYLSTSLGESWTRLAVMEPAVGDLAWIDRADSVSLLLATDAGLYELSLLPDSVPLQVLVDPKDADRGFYAVRSFVSERGVAGVAVAAQAQYGVYLSTDGGRPGSFTNVGLSRVDVRTLAVQYDGPSTVLWAGAGEADPNRPGQGCFRARLFEAGVQWQPLSAGWSGGTCWDFTFSGSTALAATQSAGVLRLDAAATNPSWQAADVNCGLPLRDRARFEPTEALASDDEGALLLAGTARGLFRSSDLTRWAAAANRETREMVTIPDTWLLCSGDHDIEVVRDDATTGD